MPPDLLFVFFCFWDRVSPTFASASLEPRSSFVHLTRSWDYKHVPTHPDLRTFKEYYKYAWHARGLKWKCKHNEVKNSKCQKESNRSSRHRKQHLKWNLIGWDQKQIRRCVRKVGELEDIAIGTMQGAEKRLTILTVLVIWGTTWNSSMHAQIGIPKKWGTDRKKMYMMFLVLGIEPRALHMTSTPSTTELQPKPQKIHLQK
jgi:hypothetical protein